MHCSQFHIYVVAWTVDKRNGSFLCSLIRLWSYCSFCCTSDNKRVISYKKYPYSTIHFKTLHIHFHNSSLLWSSSWSCVLCPLFTFHPTTKLMEKGERLPYSGVTCRAKILSKQACFYCCVSKVGIKDLYLFFCQRLKLLSNKFILNAWNQKHEWLAIIWKEIYFC